MDTYKYMRFIILITLLFFSTLGSSQNIVRKVGTVEFDWSALRWKFHGGSNDPQLDLSAREKSAWQSGLISIREAIIAMQSEQLSSPKERAVQLGNAASQSTYSRNTTYYSDGAVHVELETALVAAVAPPGVSNGPELNEDVTTKNSSLVLSLQTAIEPTAIYLIRNQFGEILFQSKDVSVNYYKKFLMGRWLSRSSGSIYRRYAGANPVEVAVEVKDGDLVVDDAIWKEGLAGNQGLLQKARIILILP